MRARRTLTLTLSRKRERGEARWGRCHGHGSLMALSQLVLRARKARGDSAHAGAPFQAAPEGRGVFLSNWRHNGIVVREARPRDLDAIARLENESFEADRVSRRTRLANDDADMAPVAQKDPP